MLTEPLFIVSVLLLVRLPLLLADQPMPWRRLLVLIAARSTALALLGPWQAATAFVVVGSLIDLSQVLLEARCTRGVTDGPVGVARAVRWVRLGSLLAHLALSIAMTSPRLGLAWRHWVVEAMQHLAREFPPLAGLTGMDHAAALVVLVGGLLCLNEANLLVRAFIDGLGLRPRDAGALAQHKTLSAEEFNRGRIIGMLERLLVYLLVLKGEYAALGLVLTAKGLARFKNLDDREFAEYFMVGTLLSLLIAGLIAETVRWVLGLGP